MLTRNGLFGLKKFLMSQFQKEKQMNMENFKIYLK